MKNLNVILKELLPRFQSHNNLIYYECFADRGLITFEELNSITEYTVEGKILQEYIRNIFGRNVGLPSLGFTMDFTFSKIDLFGEKWINRYGEIFSTS